MRRQDEHLGLGLVPTMNERVTCGHMVHLLCNDRSTAYKLFAHALYGVSKHVRWGAQAGAGCRLAAGTWALNCV